MNEYKSSVGKNLIEILMFSMYPDAKIIYREYIQNACDAIKEAVNKEVLSRYRDGHITVNIDDNINRIQISDNGIGVPFDDVEPILLNIADSRKDGRSMAGQYGIGRLVGAGYCKTLSFKTSYKGESKASEIIFDVAKAREILDNADDRRSASEVIDAITTKKEYEADSDEHYFIATLSDVRQEYPELLDEEIITNYLKEVAPIDYGLPFKNNLIHNSIPEEYRQLQNDICNFQISINEESDIRKRYGMRIEGTGDDIHTLEYFKLEDDKYGLLAWGWYAVTAFSKAIPVADSNRGIRLRKHNILIGNPDVLNQYFKEPRGNNYFYGEIHAINSKLKPESSRSGLAPTPEAICFQARLRDYFNSLVQLYHLANDTKNAVKEMSIVSTQIDDGQFLTDVPEVKDKWDAAKKKIESIERGKNAQSDVAKKVIDIIKRNIDVTPDNIDFTEKHSKQGVGRIEKSEAIDILDPLKSKYSEDKITLIRRIFSALTDNCPSKDKRLIEELKKKVVKDLDI